MLLKSLLYFPAPNNSKHIQQRQNKDIIYFLLNLNNKIVTKIVGSSSMDLKNFTFEASMQQRNRGSSEIIDPNLHHFLINIALKIFKANF